MARIQTRRALDVDASQLSILNTGICGDGDKMKSRCVILMTRASLVTALSLFPCRASKLQSLFSLAKIDHLFKDAASPVRNKRWRGYFAGLSPPWSRWQYHLVRLLRILKQRGAAKLPLLHPKTCSGILDIYFSIVSKNLSRATETTFS